MEPNFPDAIIDALFSKLLRHEPKFSAERVISGMSSMCFCWAAFQSSEAMESIAGRANS